MYGLKNRLRQLLPIIVAWQGFLLGQAYPNPQSVAELQELANRFSSRYQLEQGQIQQAPVPLLVKKSPGYANRSVALQRLRQNRPVYYKICNLDAAHTVSTPELWPGGASGLDLTGAGATIGLWDNGWPLPDHVELASRIIISDAGAATSDHATHVAGTIAASGIDGQAHGMAADAGILAYDWDNDLSELAQAASDGLVLANLSYSLAAGWELNLPNLPVNPQWAWLGDPAIDELEDWRFGFYTRESADLDQIACSAPYLLIVAAAGNDGNDGPLNDPEHWVFQIQDSDSVWVLSSAIRNGDGGYDCLPGGSAVAKNTLVVGSVNDLPEGYSDAATVTLMPLSSLGPTDDGRIKPDIVAGGSGLYSASGAGIDSYYSDSGTSMAAASVTGSLALLQQHYSQTHTGAQISAAAMKAIVIHTADDVGDMGPDYMTGWGLLNTANAADLISRDTLYPGTIIETALDDGYTYTRRVIAAGGEPLTVTLSWTDPPATVSDPALNPVTSMLVNDLNLHVTHAAGGATHYPFTLEPGQPDVPATSGINTRDNVEQVRITTPLTEEYLVAIDHSGPLQNGSQQFALTISGDNPQAWPAVLVWDGDSTAPDYSGGWIYDLFAGADSLNVTYMANMPLPDLSGFAAVFLSFGNYGDGNGSTPFDHAMVQQVIAYLESGGSLYLEGGDALIRAGDLADGAVLYQLIGIDSVADGGNENVIDSLLGQPGSIAEGMVFTSSNQVYSQYIDKYFVGSGMPVFEETGYCTVAVQNVGNSGQRTICASYSLACLADGPPPSTRQELFGAIMGFLLKDTKIPVITSIHPPAVFRGRTTYVTLYGANLDDVWEIQVDSATATNLIIDEAQGAWCAFDLNVPLNIAADTLIITAVASEFSATHGLALVDLPVAIADTFETSEDTAAVCAVLDNDTHPAGDPLKIVAVTDGGHGSVSIGPDSTTAIYDPVANYCGPDSFTYTAADTNNENISATVYMTVWPVNDRPEITSSDSVLATEGEPFVYLIEAWDVDNDSLIYDAFNLQSWLDIVDTATVSGIPDVGDTTVSFHVRASDGLLADTLEVRLLIHGMNHPPIAIADTICTLEDSAIVIPVLSNDVDIDGDTLKVVAVDSARHGLLSIGPDSLNLRYQPTADYHGADTAAYTIADGAGNSAAAFVFITVHPVNDAPGPFHLLSPIKSAAITITKQNVHDSLVFAWQPANDIDGDSVTYSFIATPDLAAAMGEFSPGSAVYLAVPMETLAVNIQADGSSGRIGTWYVTAADTALTTASANGPFIISISVEQLAAELPGPLPTEFTLGQNYPNPFNPATTMEFGLPLTGPVQLSIYDLRGRLVRRLLDRNLQPGYYQVVWDGREQTGAPAASGIYLGLLRAGQAEKRIKLVLLR